jgi:hypothetical protein
MPNKTIQNRAASAQTGLATILQRFLYGLEDSVQFTKWAVDLASRVSLGDTLRESREIS